MSLPSNGGDFNYGGFLCVSTSHKYYCYHYALDKKNSTIWENVRQEIEPNDRNAVNSIQQVVASLIDNCLEEEFTFSENKYRCSNCGSENLKIFEEKTRLNKIIMATFNEFLSLSDKNKILKIKNKIKLNHLQK